MLRRMGSLGLLARRLAHDTQGSLAVVFAIALIPLLFAIGAAIDYSRAVAFSAATQAALDSAVLAGAKDGTSNWTQVAMNTFKGVMTSTLGSTATPTFQKSASDTYTGSVNGSVPTAFLDALHVPSIAVALSATAVAAGSDDSCILTLDHGQPPTHVSLSLNGAPVVNLSGCSIRSNTSIDCNGHDGYTTRALAAGTAGECTHPSSYSPSVPDVYAALAANITSACGSSRAAATWSAGTLPAGPGVVTQSVAGRTEYHICGDLTLTGSGYLTGAAPGTDSVIVIENGSLNLASGANIATLRTAIILTGDNSSASRINFPTGNGHVATLSLSAPIDAANPWQGVALYQDPKLTYQVDNRWGPGANFNANGLVYLGNSNIVTDGNTGSSNSACSKFVMNSFTTNGNVDLDLQQQAQACTSVGLKQWGGIVVHLIE